MSDDVIFTSLCNKYLWDSPFQWSLLKTVYFQTNIVVQEKITETELWGNGYLFIKLNNIDKLLLYRFGKLQLQMILTLLFFSLLLT